MTEIANPVALFSSGTADLLELGALYIGKPNTDPMVPANQIALFWDEGMTIPVAQPVLILGGMPLNGSAPANLYAEEKRFSYRLNDAAGAQIDAKASVYPIPAQAADAAQAVVSSLSSPTGADNIGVSQPAGSPSPIPSTAQIKLRETPLTPRDWSMSVGLGNATTDTGAIKNMVDYAIANRRECYLPSSYGGEWRITPGVLKFDSAFTDKFFPDINTDGVLGCKFKVDPASTVDAPILAITNGTATSPAGRYFHGSRIGSIYFEDTRAGAYTNSHSLSLQGIIRTRFEYIYSQTPNGDLLNVPAALYGGNNPDPSAISVCHFEGLEARSAKGATIRNLNFAGFDGVVIDSLRGIENLGGGMIGVGQGCSVLNGSFGSCKGWAFDDGTFVSATGGAPNRLELHGWEIDDCEYGMRFNRITNSIGKIQARINHRHNFSSLNPNGGYWPRVGLSVGEGTLPQVRSMFFDLIHRIEAGGPKSAMGKFFQSGPSIGYFELDQLILDNAGFGFADTELYTGLNFNSVGIVRRDGKVIWDSNYKSLIGATFSGTMPIGTASYASSAAILAFNNERFDSEGNFDPSTFGFTAPYKGRYLINLSLMFASPVGTRIRMSALQLRSGVYTPLAVRSYYAGTASATNYNLYQVVDLEAGDVVFASGDQNTAGSINMSPIFSNAGEVVLQVQAL